MKKRERESIFRFEPVGFLTLLVASFLVTWYFPLYSLPIYLLFPLYSLGVSHVRGFVKVKLLTLLLGKFLFVLTILAIVPSHAFEIIVLVLVSANIAEAVIEDFMGQNPLNAISGIALIATWLLFSIHWNPSTNGYLMLGHASALWIAAYTIWNWQFAVSYLKQSAYGYLHACVLAAPIICCFIFWNADVWVYARTITLTVGLAFQLLQEDLIVEKFNTKFFRLAIAFINTQTAKIASISTVLALCSLFLLLNS